jgi:cytoskeletal protein RodZ
MPDNNNPSNSSILKDTREAKGMTLEIVHVATKIPLDALKAIEQGYSVRMLTPFYYRGFIKIYADFLGLDQQEVFKAYNMDKKPGPVLPAPVTRASRVQKPVPALEHTQEFFRTAWTPKNIKKYVRIILLLVAIFAIVKIVGCTVQKIKATPKHKAVAVKPVEEKRKATVKEEVVSVPTPPKPVKAESSNNRVSLVLRSPRDTWIQVKADGRTVFAMTMHKGTMETWNAKDQIELSGRNIGELEMEINGKYVGPLSSAHRRAKRVVINKEGLSVIK